MHPDTLGLPDLQSRDSGNKGQVIVLSTPAVTRPRPATDLAVFDWLRVVRCNDAIDVLQRRLCEPPANNTNIRREILHAVRLERAVGVRCHYMKPLWVDLLGGSDDVGVKCMLQYGSAAGLLGELGVRHLIGPGSERASTVHPPEYVWPTNPTAVAEAWLHEDVRTLSHRLGGPVDSFIAPVIPNVDDGWTLSPQRFHVSSLVVEAALLKSHLGIPPGWGCSEPTGNREVQPRQTATGTKLESAEAERSIPGSTSRAMALSRPSAEGLGALPGAHRSRGSVPRRPWPRGKNPPKGLPGAGRIEAARSVVERQESLGQEHVVLLDSLVRRIRR